MMIMVRPWLIDLSSLHRLDPFARAHAGERLVEQQQARRGGERKADFQPPLLAVGELRHRRVGALGEVDEFERVLDLLAQARNLRHARSMSSRNLPRNSASAAIVRFSRTVRRREELVDLVALGQAELAHVGDGHAGDVAALEHDFAGGGRHLAGQHLEEGRFAGAVRADNAAQLAVVHGEIDVAVGEQRRRSAWSGRWPAGSGP